MKKKIILSILFGLALTFIGCNKNDDIGPSKPRDYTEQYAKDLADIEQFLKTHSYEVVNHPGFHDDQDVIFHDVEEGDPDAIWSSPLLTFRTVKTYRDADEDIEYKLYYLKLREGGGIALDKPFPTNTDQVLAAYTGKYLFHYESTDDQGTVIDSLKYFEFETNPYPQTNFNLQEVIRGWSEVFPQFKGGDATQVSGEPTLYTDFGAGVMFIPSALGYYNQGSGSIPAYSPLIFTFKLYNTIRVDSDGDGIMNYLEDRDNDRYMYIILNDEGTGDMRPDDVDGDGAPNYLDQDDDGDNVLTEIEMLSDPNNPDSATLTWDEVPDCSGNTTDPNRLKRVYDSSCTGIAP